LRIEGNYSQDHGQTWLDHPFTVDDGVSDAKLPRACCDSSGTVYVLWRDERNGEFDLYVNVSRDFGVTWFEEDVCVTCDSAPEVVGNFPVICCDEWGRVYVAWWDSFDDVQVRFRGSEDYGVTWGEEKQLGSPEALPAWEPVIGCNESGHVFVAWEDARVPWTIYSTYSTDYGKTWFEGDHRLDSAPGMSTHLVLTGDRFGHFYVAWDDWRHDGVQGDIYFNVATPAVDARILTEENPVVISQAGGSFDFDVVLENNTDATIPEVRVYIDAASRSGRVKGPLFGPMVVDLHPGNPRAGGASQGIPPGVRPGLYAYRVNLAGSVDDRNLFYIRVLE
jgi:hypothetical protein